MVMHLRPYQRLALYHLRRCLEAGVQRLYVDLPTGTGKSTIAAAFAAQQFGQTQGRVLALVHEATAGLFREAFAGKEAAWLDEPATEKQLEALGSHRLRPDAPRVVPRSRQTDFKKGKRSEVKT
jgi:Type III restriction enzyme, res subunit